MPNAVHLFTLGSVPVYANLWFLLIIVLLSSQERGGPAYALSVSLAWTISLLVHEFGHALVARRYGLNPRILLHGIGGLCAHEPIDDDRKNAFIVAAGPGLEIIFGLVVLLIQSIISSNAPDLMYQPIDSTTAQITPLGYFLKMTVVLSIVWGLANLIPLYPLDGGQLFRLFARRRRKPAEAERLTHMVSIGFAVVGMIWGISVGSFFIVILTGFLAYSNYEAFSQLTAANPSLRRFAANPVADALLREAEAAFAEQDWFEAARLAHQIRDQASVSPTLQERAFELIVLANVALERWDEASGFVDHAPATPAIAEARSRIAEGLEKEAADDW